MHALSRFLIYTLVVVSVAVGLAAGGFYLFNHRFYAPGPLDTQLVVEIPKGSSAKAIIQQLSNAGVIEHPILFSLQLWMKGNTHRLRAGEYAFAAHIPAADVLYKLVNGDVVIYKWAVPEGLTSAVILESLRANPLLTGPVVDTLPEASILPETYFYERGESRMALLHRAELALTRFLEEAWVARDPGLAVKTPEEALTLASIVEKETAAPAERPLIARVFLNRLEKRMPLQADPTVIYAITQGKVPLERSLSKRDLMFASPYNTYYQKGLPPGPIAHPGAAAILAVLHPAASQSLYFVARGDGTHVFSSQLRDHQHHVKQLRLLEQSLS